ncbi:ead/Ea22-like family protein [Escherichia coli]|nr:ead/Ea22-like family protein [Escherichia coli]MCW3253868.1 ead/Ea22-like family protein [Escherichia coli]MCW7085677.1 ead/Ea22-like family protein [Escherichia coli]MCW7214875.1 ead/Ea22-like family protein [Escherichia coli]MCW7242426.1 ead/Ea22-like family protein [Escherichia coli]
MERLLMLPVDDDLLTEQELKDYGVDIDALNAFKFLAGPETVLALLDERERNQQYIKRRDQENEEIALTVGKLRVELEKAKSKLNEQREYYEGVISDGSKRIAELEKSEEQLINERDHAESALADMYFAATGNWPEWSNWFSFSDAVDAVVDRIADLEAKQPSPVVPEEISTTHTMLPAMNDQLMAFGYVKGRNACRAAMLQGSQPVSQTYKLPVNTPCQDAPAHIWLQTAGVWPEDGELSELTWCSHNQHHDDTLYVRADLVNGNYPATPDGWISCSERMPEETKMLLAFSQGEIVAAYWNWVVNPIDYKKYRAFTYLSGNILDDVTHWMPLPEPPQEVNQ